MAHRRMMALPATATKYAGASGLTVRHATIVRQPATGLDVMARGPIGRPVLMAPGLTIPVMTAHAEAIGQHGMASARPARLRKGLATNPSRQFKNSR
jgi:hypothetical protein